MKYGEGTGEDVERVTKQIVDAALTVHKALGPGLLESVYETCLAYELNKRGLRLVRQQKIAVFYDGQNLDCDLHLDLLVEDCVIVEVKAVESLNALFHAQVLTYLKLTGKKLGLLVNFNVPLVRDGIKRVVRSRPE